jgi:hypothetical protein
VKQAILTVTLSLGVVASVAAQQRPLLTEDPETVGGGRLLIEAGVDVERDVFYPASGLRGDRLVAPTIGFSIGLSSIAELQIDGAFYQRLNITERRSAPLSGVLDFAGDQTTDVDDFVVATKLRLVTEGDRRPAIGLRLATKLPNSSNESGLGTDMTDFFASMLFAKTVESVRIVGNGGVAIVGDPTADVPEQTDLFAFGLSVARAMTNSTELVGEVNGRLNFTNGTPDPGAENHAVMRLGGRYTRGPVRVDGAVLLGMTSRDPGFGFTAGFTWVLNAFQVP